MRSIIRPNRIAVALSVVAILAVVGGGAYAATGSKTISACVKHKGGSLYKAKRCARGDSKLTWGKAGPAGARGARGPAGPTGPAGATGPKGNNGADGIGETYDALTTLSDGNGTSSGPTIGALALNESCAFNSGTITFTLTANPSSGSSWASQGWDEVGSGSTGLTGTTPALLNSVSNTSAGTLLAVNGLTTPPYPLYPVVGDILLTSAGKQYDVQLHLYIDANLGHCGGGVTVAPVTTT